MWRERTSARLHDEQGVALIYVLLASVIISGLVVVFMSRTLFENRQTAEARNFESAIHVGEAGAEALFGRINAEGEVFASKVVTQHPDGSQHRYDPPSGLSDAELRRWEADWATDLALADWDASLVGAYQTQVVPTDDGHAFGIRPRHPTLDEAYNIVFGVGFVPSIDHPDPTIRVVKMRIARRYFAPEHALLTGGDLVFGGNASILAPGCNPANPDPVVCNASVHGNGNGNVSGSAHMVQGNFTTTGTITGTPNTVGGTAAAGEQEEPVPPVTARDFYGRNVTYNVDPGGQPVAWYDLCPGGTVREPGATPCTGTQVWPAPGETTTNFRGWSYKSGTNNTWEARHVQPGVFYVYHADAAVNGSAGTGPRAVTILVETDSSSATTAAKSGSLEVSGNPNLVSALPDVLFIVDRDLKMKGTAAGGTKDCDPSVETCDLQRYSGFIFAGEQLDVSGTVRLRGAIVVEDREDRHGLVKRNTMGLNGTMTLDYDENLKIDLRGRVTIEYWNEL